MKNEIGVPFLDWVIKALITSIRAIAAGIATISISWGITTLPTYSWYLVVPTPPTITEMPKPSTISTKRSTRLDLQSFWISKSPSRMMKYMQTNIPVIAHMAIAALCLFVSWMYALNTEPIACERYHNSPSRKPKIVACDRTLISVVRTLWWNEGAFTFISPLV